MNFLLTPYYGNLNETNPLQEPSKVQEAMSKGHSMHCCQSREVRILAQLALRGRHMGFFSFPHGFRV